MLDKPRCTGLAKSGLSVQSSRQCLRNSSVKRGNEYFCHHHDPVKIEKKRQKKMEKYEADLETRKKEWERNTMARNLLIEVDEAKILTKSLKSRISNFLKDNY